jgi:hypothetical protein
MTYDIVSNQQSSYREMIRLMFAEARDVREQKSQSIQMDQFYRA